MHISVMFTSLIALLTPKADIHCHWDLQYNSGCKAVVVFTVRADISSVMLILLAILSYTHVQSAIYLLNM